jgi:hypothetical protein
MSRKPRVRPPSSGSGRHRRNVPLVVDEPAVASADVAASVSESIVAAPIALDIDPVVSAGYIHDRYDLLIRGRAVSTLAVEEVAVSLDDAAVGRVQFGETGQLELDYDDGIQHVFHINVPLRRAQARRTCRCVVTARSAAGGVQQETFDLIVDPASQPPVSVTSGPTLSSHAYAHVHPPVVLYVERAAMDPAGQILVHGWAVSQNPMVTIQVFIGDERVGAAQLGGQRDDIGTAFPFYPNRASPASLCRRASSALRSTA